MSDVSRTLTSKHLENVRERERRKEGSREVERERERGRERGREGGREGWREREIKKCFIKMALLLKLHFIIN